MDSYLLYYFLGVICVAVVLRYLACSDSGDTRAVWDQAFNAIDGTPMTLEQYKGKVLLVVNTASRCGFTKQYAGLQKLYETYKDKGFVVLGVPSNDFGGQEPGDATQIKQFCETNFNITFPMTDKVAARGGNAHPFFKQVRAEQGYIAAPHWNFYKYLVGRDGHIVNWFSPLTRPNAVRLERKVQVELDKHMN